eukprot:scaffold18684_cov121-Isochrysis_galbana.AAC.9
MAIVSSPNKRRDDPPSPPSPPPCPTIAYTEIDDGLGSNTNLSTQHTLYTIHRSPRPLLAWVHPHLMSFRRSISSPQLPVQHPAYCDYRSPPETISLMVAYVPKTVMSPPTAKSGAAITRRRAHPPLPK